MMYGIIFSLLPLILYVFIWVVTKPFNAFLMMFVVNYFIMGVMRYVPSLPAGVILDGMIAFTIFTLLLKKVIQRESIGFKRAFNGITILFLIWAIFCLFEIANPESSVLAWLRSVRGIALYPFIISVLTSIVLHKYEYVKKIIAVLSVLTLCAVLKALIQKYVGFDQWENYWLFVQGGAVTHVIWSGVRYFSFYSDAGNFGASMGFAAIVFLVISFYYKNQKIKIFYIFVAIAATYGMMISGTRGALAVPITGGILYLILSKKIKILLVGLILLAGTFIFLNFTTIGQGVPEIRRMRSAFNKDDASLVVRLENQKKLREIMSDMPLGTGIGLGGGKAKEFKPDAALSQIPTDSWFVLIWVETGIVGLILHIFILITILLVGSYNVLFRLKDQHLKGICAGITSGVFGIMVASYGNEILGQLPICVIIYVSQTFIFLSPRYDKYLIAERKERADKQILN
ncbi:MAG: O-antigen ligase family protein [Flavobacteriales bacterium]|nr:O-antigen ligase family protein [Flavobacteriales bacterium]